MPTIDLSNQLCVAAAQSDRGICLLAMPPESGQFPSMESMIGEKRCVIIDRLILMNYYR